MKSIKSTAAAITIALAVSGCLPIPRPKLPEIPDQNKTSGRMWDDTRAIEENYKLRPEPYSLDSKQKDPELLGPQSTLKNNALAKNDNDITVSGATTSDEQITTTDIRPTVSKPESSAKPPMDRSRCISLIGQAKFNEYAQRFGSEEAAIRRCAIMERVHK